MGQTSMVELPGKQLRYSMKHAGLTALMILAASLLLPMRCFAQKTSTLTGTVMDVSGAVVPGATVTLIDEASKAKRSTTSNGDGYFTFSAVQTGVYDVEIQAKSFTKWKVVGIQVDPGDQLDIPNIKLAVGEVKQEITVSSAQLGIDITSGEKSELITSEEIKRLSTQGRDASELVRFLPGFAISPAGGIQNGLAYDPSLMGFGSTALPGYAANGAAPQSGNTTVISDGASVVDPGDMGASISNVNMDMVEEIKVETSDFGADSAKGPIVINAVGKSGGSDYHGSAYLYARDHDLNSNDWLSNYLGAAKPQDHYYYPGANLGGPVRIPGTDFNHSKKLTFWTGFEYYDQTNVNDQVQSFVPTAGMLGGDLSAQTIATALNIPTVGALTPAQYLTSQCTNSYIGGTLSNVQGICYVPGLSYTAFTPLSGDAINSTASTGGVIPTNQIETAALNAYAQFYPKPNRTPQPIPNGYTDGINYVDNLLATHNGFQYRARVDENFSDSTKLYVTFNWEKINDENPAQNIYYFPTGTIPYPTPDFTNTRAQDLSLNFTHIFSPSLTNEFVAAGAHFYEPSQLKDPGAVSVATTGFPTAFLGPYSSTNGATQLPAIVNYQLGVPSFSMSDVPSNSLYFRKYSWSVGDNLSKQLGTHSMKFGVYGETTANNQVQAGNFAQGQYVFASYDSCTTSQIPLTSAGATNYTGLGNAIANFLVGCSQTYNQNSSDPAVDMNFKTVAFYATDEWKATKRLTLTYGARFDHLGPWIDAHGVGLAAWEPTPGMFNPTINANDPTTWPGVTWHQINSSIPNAGRTVPLAFVSPRLGLAYDVFGNGKTVIRGGWGAYRFQTSYNDYAGALDTTLGIAKYTSPVNCTYEQIGNANATGLTGCHGNVPLTPFAIYAIDPHDDEQPVTFNYNFTIDRQLPWDSILEIGYVGNQSKHLPTEGTLSNQNAIPLGGLFQPDPCPSSTSICNGQFGQVYQPDSTAFNGENIVNDYRPYRNYSQVYVTNHIGYANYNALQVSLKRQKGSFIYGANYTFSKALGIRDDYRTGYPSDPTNLNNNYGVVSFDRTHILNFVYSYQEGSRFHGSRFLQGVANGWEISGITGWQSGQDLSVLSNGGTNFGMTGGVQWNPNPGNPNSPVLTLPVASETILGTPDISLQPLVKCSPTSNLQSTTQNGLTSRQYMNGNCFALPGLGQNGPFNLPYIHAPAYFNSDLSLFKDFKLGEKRTLQFRLAGFNFLNHPSPSFYTGGSNNAGYTLSFSDPTTSTFTSEPQAISGAVAAPSFGYTPYKVNRRVVELGVKYDF